MKNTTDNLIKTYSRKVQKLIPNRCRTRLNAELQSSLSEAFHDVTDLTEDMIYKRFGTPEHFASEYLSGMDADELQAHLSRSRKQKRILFIVLVSLLLLLIPITLWICSEGERHRGYFYYNEIENSGTR